ncbi:dihydrofolate reductase family protein [bacterium AH-315-M10]|nr:dihydrofolate reductase family protein [bacterium AH-315-M10]
MTRPELAIARWLTVDGTAGPLPELASDVEAVLIGSRSVAAYDPVIDGPLVVVVSGRALVSPRARIFSAARRPVVAVSELAPRMKRTQLEAVAEVVTLGQETVDLTRLLEHLARAHGVRRLVSPGGEALHRSLFEAGLVDSLQLRLSACAAGRWLSLTGQQDADGDLLLNYQVKPDASEG